MTPAKTMNRTRIERTALGRPGATRWTLTAAGLLLVAATAAAVEPARTAGRTTTTGAETAGAGPAGAGLPLDEILRRFDETQSSVHTLTAKFSETKTLALLKEPAVSQGKFFYTHPNDILWQYDNPSRRIFLIRRNELLSYFPAEKRAEKIDISRYQTRLLKVLGIGQVSKDLMKYYRIALAGDSPTAGPHELVLTPRKRQVRKHIDEVRIWVDEKSFLPVRMSYTEEDGDQTTISFESVRINAPIDESTYQIQLPPDVTVQKTFSGLGSGRGAS